MNELDLAVDLPAEPPQPSIAAVPAVRDAMLSGRFVGSRDGTLAESLAGFLGGAPGEAIDGWFGANPSARLSDFISGDGLRLDSAFTQLVSAMAVYQANNPGFDPSTAGSMPTDSTLRNAISTAWHS